MVHKVAGRLRDCAQVSPSDNWKTLFVNPAVNGYQGGINSERPRMSSALHLLCPRYRGPLTPTALMAIKLWESFAFFNP